MIQECIVEEAFTALKDALRVRFPLEKFDFVHKAFSSNSVLLIYVLDKKKYTEIENFCDEFCKGLKREAFIESMKKAAVTCACDDSRQEQGFEQTA